MDSIERNNTLITSGSKSLKFSQENFKKREYLQEIARMMQYLCFYATTFSNFLQHMTSQMGKAMFLILNTI